MNHSIPSARERSTTVSTRSTSPISFAVVPSSNDLVNLEPLSRPKRTRRPATAPSDAGQSSSSLSTGQQKWANPSGIDKPRVTRPATADAPIWNSRSYEDPTPLVQLSRPATPSKSSRIGDMARSLKKKASAPFLSGSSSNSRPPKSPIMDKALPPVPAPAVTTNPFSNAHSMAHVPPPFTKVTRKEVNYNSKTVQGTASAVTISLSPTQEVRVVGKKKDSPTRQAFTMTGLALQRTVTAPDSRAWPDSRDAEKDDFHGQQATTDMQDVLSRLRRL